MIAGALLARPRWPRYFLLISPQNSKAAELAKEAESAQAEITPACASSRAGPADRADSRRRPLPPHQGDADDVDMPGVILELNRIARDDRHPLRLDHPAGARRLHQRLPVVPINLVFQGNYFELSDFLFRVRNLVGVRGGQLDATGRLFVVDSVAFSEGVKKFPQIQATLTVSALHVRSRRTPRRLWQRRPRRPAATPPASPATPVRHPATLRRRPPSERPPDGTSNRSQGQGQAPEDHRRRRRCDPRRAGRLARAPDDRADEQEAAAAAGGLDAPCAACRCPGVPVSPSVPPALAASGTLSTPIRRPPPEAGQLVSFGRFVSKDPFAPQASKRCADDNGASVACPAPAPGSTSKPQDA